MSDDQPAPDTGASSQPRPYQAHPEGPQSESVWVRLLYMILFAAFSYVVLWLFLALSLFQFVIFVIGGKTNDELGAFLRRLLHFMGSILAYIAFLTETKPFPFSAFPDGSPKEG